MRLLKLSIGDPLCLTLAADARTSPVQYADDIIWQASLGGGAPPALALETTLGLRARILRLFLRFIRQDNDLIDPLEYSQPPVILQQMPGYMRIQAAPFSGIELTQEYWIPASSVAAGRITLRNNSILRENLRMQLCGVLAPQGDGAGFAAQLMGASTVLLAKSGGLSPVLFVTGGPETSSGPFPNLTSEIDLYPGSERQLTWAMAALPDVEASFHLARLTTSRLWDAEITRMELVHTSQVVQVQTPNPDWNAVIHLGQSTTFRLLMPPGPKMPAASFVLAREPEHGFSQRGDGSDYSYLWNGYTAMDAWTMANSLLPGAPETARGLVTNLLADSPDGKVDFKPGWAGQRSRLLAQPLLASLAWRIHSADPNPGWLKSIFEPLVKFVHLWLSPEHDQDGDNYPEWDHPLQTGLEQAPLYDRWHPSSQGVDIRMLECPGLGAMLYRECRSLAEIARLLKQPQEADWLDERALALRDSVEATWDESASTYRYCDVTSQQSLSGGSIISFSASGKQRVRRKFSPARRILIRLQVERENQGKLLVRLHGQTANGSVIEEIGAQRIKWLQENGRVCSQNLFTSLEYAEMIGLESPGTASINTIDYLQEDISLLLPLWAGIPSPERARQLIERTILPRYLQAYGLSSCPAQNTPVENPDLGCASIPWNCFIGEGLLRYDYRDLAGELLSRLMRTLIAASKQEQAFRAPLCSLEGSSSGEKNTLSSLPPLGLFWQVLGLVQISNTEVILQSQCPLPSPITVQYQGTNITFQTKSSVVQFPNGESVTVTKPGLRHVQR